MTNTQTISAADETLRQLGGANKLKIMIGAHDFYSENEGMTLYFRFKMCEKANVCKITINGSDLYNVEFIKRGRLNVKTLEVPSKRTGYYSDIHCEDLKKIIEDFTGLFLSL